LHQTVTLETHYSAYWTLTVKTIALLFYVLLVCYFLTNETDYNRDALYTNNKQTHKHCMTGILWPNICEHSMLRMKVLILSSLIYIQMWPNFGKSPIWMRLTSIKFYWSNNMLNCVSVLVHDHAVHMHELNQLIVKFCMFNINLVPKAPPLWSQTISSWTVIESIVNCCNSIQSKCLVFIE